jgi:hypothetical protein
VDDDRIRREMLEKYRQIAFLRAAEAAGTLPDPAPVARALATRFPGALRELDRLPPRELARTLAVLVSTEPLSHADRERFRVLDAYHEALRGLLEAKRWLAGAREVSADRAAAFARASELSAAARSWADQLAQIARPSSGRLAVLALARVAEARNTTADEIARHIDPAQVAAESEREATGRPDPLTHDGLPEAAARATSAEERPNQD